MSDQPPRRSRRRVREALDAIGTGIGERLPPPSPPSLGEGLLEQARNPRIAVAMSAALEGENDPGTRILVALARIEERQNSLVDANRSAQMAAEARHANVMSAIATFVPRSEIEKDNRAIHERIDAVEERVKTMDKRVWAAVTGALGAFGSVILTKVGLLH